MYFVTVFFIFKVLWKYSGEIQPLKLMARDTTSIGQYISTKAIGTMEREVSNHLFYFTTDLLPN